MTSHFARTLVVATMTLTLGVALSGNAHAGQDRTGVSAPPARTLQVFDHLARADRAGPRDPYTDGARLRERNPFVDGARIGPRSSFSDGA
ncbi:MULTISPECIES: hypothetical protein [unclassified Cupriavidus]|uniref:hypothetical protein n=1 Tax=unclassified Cupriavidus TaxID=2640874 RepID=UPI00313A9DCD